MCFSDGLLCAWGRLRMMERMEDEMNELGV